MISLCVVTIDVVEKYFEKIFIESLNKLKLVSEVIFAKVDANETFREEWTVNHVEFKKFGCPTHFLNKKIPDYPAKFINSEDHGIQHALALHKCIEKSKNQLVLLSDPDLFFCGAVDEIYWKLMQDNKLDIIGCSHHHSVQHASTFFPNQISLLVDKTTLPDASFLENKIKRRSYKLEGYKVHEMSDFPGKFLLPGVIPEYANMFPNPDGLFETGCNLYLWAIQKKWKWLSFQTLDCHLYTTLYHKYNEKVPKPRKVNLIHHCNHGFVIANELNNIELHKTEPSGMMAIERYEQYNRAYQLSKSED